MKRKWFVMAAAVAAVSTCTFFAAYAVAANFQTFYCGSSTSYCTLNDTGVHTASTALRDQNHVHCLNPICHTDLWYAIPGGNQFYKLASSGGAQDLFIGTSGGNFAYSWCATSIGFGTNTARCDTLWHT